MARTETMEARVLAWMETTDGNWITAQEAAQQIRPGIDWKQARGALDRLRKRGLVQRLRAQVGWLPTYRLRPRSTTDCGGCKHLLGDEPDWQCGLGRDLLDSSFPQPCEPCVHYDGGSGGGYRDEP